MNSNLASNNNKGTSTVASGTKADYPWIKATLQIIPYSIVCICLLEGIFYFARVGESDHLTPDSKLGFKPFANKRVTQRNEGFGSFHFNSFGMQNDEVTVSKPANTFRIAVFGDSYVESLQVPREYNYCSLLAAKLSSRLDKPVQVLNFGVSNYSLAQDYLRYQTLAKNFEPDLAIIAYRVGETEKVLPDSTKSLAFVRPMLFPQEDGTLKYDNSAVTNFTKSKEGKRIASTHFLREHSRIWSTIGRMQQNSASLTRPLASKKSATVLIANENTREKFVTCYWYLIDALIKNFTKECTANHTSMLIMRTPMVHPGEYILSQNKVETSMLKATAKAAKTAYIDIDVLLQENAKAHNFQPYFLDGSHFSKQMHNFVADQLTAEIANNMVNTLRPTDNKKRETK